MVDHGVLALHDLAGDDDHALELSLGAGVEEGARRVDDDLGAPVVVAEVDEEDAAVVALVEYPAAETHGLAVVCRAELAAVVGSEWMHSFQAFPEKFI